MTGDDDEDDDDADDDEDDDCDDTKVNTQELEGLLYAIPKQRKGKGEQTYLFVCRPLPSLPLSASSKKACGRLIATCRNPLCSRSVHRSLPCL